MGSLLNSIHFGRQRVKSVTQGWVNSRDGRVLTGKGLIRNRTGAWQGWQISVRERVNPHRTGHTMGMTEF